MRTLKAIGGSIKNFMILFSFIVNLILVVVLVVLGLMLFEIKNNIATPLVSGLHSSFVGLDEATIDWTIPVRADVPVNLDIALQQNTTVILTESVPLNVSANIILPGVGNLNNASVSLTLPAGTRLPVALDLNVPVRDTLPIALDVRAVIPLDQTQLHDPLANLQLMFDPLTRILFNLPDGFGDVPGFVADAFDSNGVDLLAQTPYNDHPWPGFSQTAGVGYTLGGEPVPPSSQAIDTGIVPVGGIPSLDAQMRPDVYAQGGPDAVNQQAVVNMESRGLPPSTYQGSAPSAANEQPPGQPDSTVITSNPPEPGQEQSPQDLGIMPTPGGG
ncbi:MAG: hypothetical protein IT320_24550 [Anaerolineae bacterium]|nr:hypothetical protein [Anaerolineae bacterium]